MHAYEPNNASEQLRLMLARREWMANPAMRLLLPPSVQLLTAKTDSNMQLRVHACPR